MTLNLGLLAYFKYVNFFIDNLNAVLGSLWPPASVVLPIGISFYSFTQIAFLVDTYQGKVQEAKFIHYGLFVTYFPHLIAGPVLHHSQMMPQFAAAKVYLPRSTNLVAGSFIFCLGLFKKVILADGIGPYADAVFRAADLGDAISGHTAVPPRRATDPSTAVLSASVPLPVKMTSPGRHPITAATTSRASSIARRASRAKRCEPDGLAKCSERKGSIAATACGRIGVVAAWSR